jgi:hypothetical protein
MGAEVLITLILGLLDRASAIGALLTKARGEGRDVTAAELDALRTADDLARQQLVDAIAVAKAAGK